MYSSAGTEVTGFRQEVQTTFLEWSRGTWQSCNYFIYALKLHLGAGGGFLLFFLKSRPGQQILSKLSISKVRERIFLFISCCFYKTKSYHCNLISRTFTCRIHVFLITYFPNACLFYVTFYPFWFWKEKHFYKIFRNVGNRVGNELIYWI